MIEERTIRHSLVYSVAQLEEKKVAVYARVSRQGEMKHHSIEMQKENLKSQIEEHPGWKFTDIYVDEGYTGTKMDRPAFNRMMDDARHHKIDIILTKAVSRFGRNLKAVLGVLEELRSLDVTVIFDNEQISTANPESMLSLQMLAINAETEARQNSEYQKWSIRNRFKEGIPNYTRMYGYIMKNHKLEIIPEEAEVIKRIFKMYLDGKGIYGIAKELNKEGVPKYSGDKWIGSSIYRILTNEKYAGDLLLQKKYVVDYLTKTERPNRGVLPQYFVTNAHEPIIDRETFDQVQAEIKRRAEVFDVPSIVKTRGHQLFSQLLYCAHCGAVMHYKLHQHDGYKRKIWVCSDYMRFGARYCPVYSVREDTLIKVTNEVLQEAGLIKPDTPLTNDLLKKYIQRIYADEDHRLEYHMVDGSVITKTWEFESRSKSWTPEMREKARVRALEQHAKQKGSANV